jgi:hypothetical protein
VPALPRRASSPTASGDAEENIVAARFARYIIGCESADRARCPAALRRPTALSATGLPPRRVAAPGYAACLKPEAECVCGRDADDRIPRRYDLKRHRLSATQHRVAGRF